MYQSNKLKIIVNQIPNVQIQYQINSNQLQTISNHQLFVEVWPQWYKALVAHWMLGKQFFHLHVKLFIY